jgi:hypothetical protein
MASNQRGQRPVRFLKAQLLADRFLDQGGGHLHLSQLRSDELLGAVDE